MVRRYRERLKLRPGGRVQRGGAFQADFPGAPTEDSEAEKTPSQGRKRTRKRGNTKADPSKKATPKCPAYGIRGHDLPACWHIFEELRLKGYKPSMAKIYKSKEAIEKDEELKRRVEQIRLEKKEQD